MGHDLAAAECGTLPIGEVVVSSRADSYKQLRILLDPDPFGEGCYLSVVARVSDRGRHRDRTLSRRRLGVGLDDASVAEILESAGNLLLAEAEHLYEQTR